MKKIFISVFILISLCKAHASDGTVILELKEYNNYKVPGYNTESFLPTNQDGEIISKDNDFINCIDDDSRVFESKTGRFFENFINEKALEKKPNILPQQFNHRQYSELQ